MSDTEVNDPQPTVRILKLPGLTGDGDDIEQWLGLPTTPKTPEEIRQELERLAAELTPVDLATIEPEPEPKKILPEPDRDPHRLAKVILGRYTDSSGHRLLVSYQDEIYRYYDDYYHKDPHFVKTELVQLIKEDVDRCYEEALKRRKSRLAANKKKPEPPTPVPGENEQPTPVPVENENEQPKPPTPVPTERLNSPTLIPVTQKLCADVFHALRSMITIKRSEQPPFWIDPQPGDIDPTHLLPMRNGLLDISQDPPQLCSYTPEYFSTSKLAYDYDPSAPPPTLWFKLLNDQWANDPDTINLIYEMFGYLLTSDTSMQVIFLWIGPRRSGRGTMLRVLQQLVGLENTTATSAESLSGPFGLALLLNKTVAIMGDARTGDSHDTAVMLDRLLRISGDDLVEVNRKYKDPLPNVKMKIRFLIVSNELPNFRDPAMANVARYRIIKAKRVIPEEDRDPKLSKKITASELPGLLNLALEGRRRLYARGRFLQPSSAKDLIEMSENIANPKKAFIEERYDLVPNHHERKDDVFECWKEWAMDQNLQVGSKEYFSRDLLAAFPNEIEKSRPKDGKYRIHTFKGIQRKEEDYNKMIREI